MNAITHIEEPLISQFASPELLELIGMSDRSISVIGDRLLYGMTFEQIAEKHDVTRERARQLYVKAIANVAKRLNWHVRMWKKLPEIERENERLGNRLSFYEEQEKKGLERKLPPSIDDPIEDLELSVRLYNALKAGRINTLRQVLALKKRELLQYRNFGKKTLDELEGLLNKSGITDWQ
jgi:hypothetical protein